MEEGYHPDSRGISICNQGLPQLVEMKISASSSCKFQDKNLELCSNQLPSGAHIESNGPRGLTVTLESFKVTRETQG